MILIVSWCWINYSHMCNFKFITPFGSPDERKRRVMASTKNRKSPGSIKIEKCKINILSA